MHTIYSNVIYLLPKSLLLHPCQHGRRRCFSCETQVFGFVTDLQANFHTFCQTDAIFIDFAEAFDTVPHNRLIYRLSIKYPSCTYHLDKTFLFKKKQEVFTDDSFSHELPVISGRLIRRSVGPSFIFYKCQR